MSVLGGSERWVRSECLLRLGTCSGPFRDRSLSWMSRVSLSLR